MATSNGQAAAYIQQYSTEAKVDGVNVQATFQMVVHYDANGNLITSGASAPYLSGIKYNAAPGTSPLSTTPPSVIGTIYEPSQIASINATNVPGAIPLEQGVSSTTLLPTTAVSTDQAYLSIDTSGNITVNFADYISGSGSKINENAFSFKFQDPNVLTQIKTEGSNTLSLSASQVRAEHFNDGKLVGKGSLAPTSGSVNSISESTYSVVCYKQGTHILCQDGPVRVEDLKVGQMVLTADGSHEPIIWIGQRSLDCSTHPNPDKAYPVCIHQNAFGAGLPERDLFVSPDHSLFIDGVMVPAFCLIDGKKITQNRQETEVTYYHVELPAHFAIFAEGLMAESYLDTTEANRMFFNRSAASASTTDEKSFVFADKPHDMPTWQYVWQTQGYAPLVTSGEKLQQVIQRISTPDLIAA